MCRHAEAVAEARNMTLGGDAQAPEVLALRSQALYLCGARHQTAQSCSCIHAHACCCRISIPTCGCHWVTMPGCAEQLAKACFRSCAAVCRQHADGAAAVPAGAQVRQHAARGTAVGEGPLWAGRQAWWRPCLQQTTGVACLVCSCRTSHPSHLCSPAPPGATPIACRRSAA